eukprot:scaffold11635_cov107-Isochrysis_galbana.AAC.4
MGQSSQPPSSPGAPPAPRRWPLVIAIPPSALRKSAAEALRSIGAPDRATAGAGVGAVAAATAVMPELAFRKSDTEDRPAGTSRSLVSAII